MLKEDFKRYTDTIPRGLIKRINLILRDQGLQAIIIFRLGHWLLDQNILIKVFIKPVYMVLNRRIKSKWGIEIHPYAKIGKGFRIYHFGGIFISGEAVIGENFSMGHNVTIGVSRGGVPVIGNNVTVAPGASIHGKITVGNNVKIGANAVVNRNIPDYALVQVPAMQVVRFPTLYGKKTDAPGKNLDEK